MGEQEHKNRRRLQLMDEHDKILRKKLTEGVAMRDEDITDFVRSHRQQEVK